MLSHLIAEGCQLVRLILIGGDHQNDQRYCSLANLLLSDKGIKADVEFNIRPSDEPAALAKLVSNTVRSATADKAELWVDLTPGPKERSAVIFASASAVSDARIFYSPFEDGSYKVRQLAQMGSYNQWIGQHGIRIRNYREEIASLAEMYEHERPVRRDEIDLAISDLLGVHPGLDEVISSPRANLITLAEWAAKDKAHILLGTASQDWKGKEDEAIRKVNQIDSKTRSAGRASQLVYQLRCLFGHDKESGQQPTMSDAIALLDCLALLSARFSLLNSPSRLPTRLLVERIFVAVDGDDVGRKFERRLADCVGIEDVLALEQWSQQIQRELSDLMLRLQEQCEGVFLVRTGDGFLAAIPQDNFPLLDNAFSQNNSIVSVTTGIGKTVKDAYLALKLGKAKNRGGGIFFSLNPPEEKILWPVPEPSPK